MSVLQRAAALVSGSTAFVGVAVAVAIAFANVDRTPAPDRQVADLRGPTDAEAPDQTLPDRLAFLPDGVQLLPQMDDEDLDVASIAVPPAAPAPQPLPISTAWSVETLPERPAHEPGRGSVAPSAKPAIGLAGDYSPALAKRLAEIGPGATQRLARRFEAAHVPFPPEAVTLVAIKEEKMLELHARMADGSWKFIHRYPVLAASGTSGPKLKQGDKQVPEGIYAISYLNPNSRYHVSMRVDYPNAFDRQMAAVDGRHDLGGDIMIHGKAASVGCLAVGDEAAEELFVLAAKTGRANLRLIIAPFDFRRRGVAAPQPGSPPWVGQLYGDIALAMADTKAPPQPSFWSFFSN